MTRSLSILSIIMPLLGRGLKMKIKVKGFIDVLELAGFFGLSLLAFILFAISLVKGYLVEGFVGLVIYFAIMLVYNRINKGNIFNVNNGRNTKYRLRILNSKRLFSYTISIWGTAIMLFTMSQLGVTIFPIKLFFITTISLFILFFGENIIIHNEFTENKILIFFSILFVLCFSENQAIKISMLPIAVLIALFTNNIVNKAFEHKIYSYNELILAIINKSQNRNVTAIITIAIIFTYCFLSNIITDYWKLLLGTIVMAIIAFFIHEQIFGESEKYLSPDEYFYRRSCYLAKKVIRAPKYENGDWIDRLGVRRPIEMKK